MGRRADLDTGDLERPIGKHAEMLDAANKAGRDLDRGGLRDLDNRTEQLTGLTRHQRDVNRFIPRDGTSSTLRARTLPPDAHPRRLTVYRQRILNKQKTALDRAKVPVRSQKAFVMVFRSSAELRSINDQLSANSSDIQALDEATQTTIHRLDRVIRMAEERSTAENLVYTPIKLPPSVNSGNVAGWLNNNFAEGTEVDFDRYTITSHEMSQAAGRRDNWQPVCEIVTRRGAYVGLAPKTNDTNSNASHILPRGMALRCVGIKTVPVVGRDGSTSQRLVLQMEDHR